MDSIRIDTGVKRISINDDPSRVIEFNPSDVVFAERFYGLLRDFEVKQVDYAARSKEIDSNQAMDADGLPVNLPQRLAFLREVCEFLRERIDRLFGPGTSQTVFGDAMTLEMFAQFFEGITPFVQTARAEKLVKYAGTPRAGKRKRVMK